MSIWTEFLSWFQSTPDFQKALYSGAVALLVAFILWLVKVARRFPSALFAFLRAGRSWGTEPYGRELQIYREFLDEDTFRVHHAWMKEGQTLKDILVPVVVDTADEVGGIENLPVALAQIFDPKQKAVSRLVVIGGPGSGKSVALRLAARRVWDWPADDGKKRVPVLITFSEYRDADFDLPKALAESLLSRGVQPATGPDGGELARTFVDDFLRQGRLAILVDALDELELDDRNQAARRLSVELKTYAQCPAIVSCRQAAWKEQIKSLQRKVIRVADFTPAAVEDFVRKWNFKPPKSHQELLKVINTQPHVGDLARNPLMLTIITFLYSQPKYRLPENRAQFYEVCSRALLEEWDQAQNPDRANLFDRPHKEYLLGRLAYEHMNGPTPDRDIEESLALATLGDGMQRDLGLQRAENAKMLEEIVVNSGLLSRLPPSGLRFPHQTFLEYFAALHILRTQTCDDLLAHYRKDPERWREVVLLYCGLNPKIEDNEQVLLEFLASGSVEMALAALTDVRAIRESVAVQVLGAVEHKVSTEPSIELFRDLGYVSGNPRSSYAGRAGEMVQDLLGRAVSDGFPPTLLHELLLAALRRPAAKTVDFIVENTDRLELSRILPEMGDDALVIASQLLLQPDLEASKKKSLINGLRQAGAVRLLLDIAVMKHLDDEVRLNAELALANVSGQEGFFDLLDDANTALLDGGEGAAVFGRWGWPFDMPSTRDGKIFACGLASRLAEELKSEENIPFTVSLQNIQPRLEYLARGLGVERNPRVRLWSNKSEQMIENATPNVLRFVWRKADSKKWARWVEIVSRHEDKAAVVGCLLGVVVSCWALLAIAALAFGAKELGVSWQIPVAHFLFGVVVALVGVPLKSINDRVSFLIGVCVPFYVISDMIVKNFRGGFIRIIFLYGAAFVVLSLFVLVALDSGPGPFSVFFGALLATQMMGLLYDGLPVAHPIWPTRHTKVLFSKVTQPVQRKQPTSSD